jgi:hypothetical protein
MPQNQMFVKYYKEKQFLSGADTIFHIKSIVKEKKGLEYIIAES